MPFVNVKSHRAGHKLDRLLGHHPQYFVWRFTLRRNGYLAQVTDDELVKIKAEPIKGISGTRAKREDLLMCW